ncbi:hypothetical protein MMC29_003005 [Sticta canariensis]|nr:hypothetical protein [Sticta canariensis]
MPSSLKKRLHKPEPMQDCLNINSVDGLLRPAVGAGRKPNKNACVLQKDKQGTAGISRPKRGCILQVGVSDACTLIASSTSAESPQTALKQSEALQKLPGPGIGGSAAQSAHIVGAARCGLQHFAHLAKFAESFFHEVTSKLCSRRVRRTGCKHNLTHSIRSRASNQLLGAMLKVEKTLQTLHASFEAVLKLLLEAVTGMRVAVDRRIGTGVRARVVHVDMSKLIR